MTGVPQVTPVVNAIGGVHIHRGTSCDKDAGPHLFNPTTTVKVSNKER